VYAWASSWSGPTAAWQSGGWTIPIPQAVVNASVPMTTTVATSVSSNASTRGILVSMVFCSGQTMAMTNSDIVTGEKTALPNYRAAVTRIAVHSTAKIRIELSPAIGSPDWSVT